MIATLATQAADAGIDVVVVTGDRDTYQLVRDPHLKVLYNRRGVSDYALYDEAGIVERTGRHARAVPASTRRCAATPSDNLPGVPGIGEKTAAKLVTTYGDLEGIFEHLDELPPKQRQNLGEARDRVFLNREMSLLRRDVRLDVDAERAQAGRVGPRAGARAVRPARVPHAAAAAARGGRRRRGRGRRSRDARRRGRRAARRRRRASSGCDALAKRASRYALEPQWDGAPVTQRAARRSRSPTATGTSRTSTPRCSQDRDGARRARRAGRDGRPAARRAPRQGADARARRRRPLARPTTPR